MPITLFYVLALVLPALAAFLTGAAIRRAWVARGKPPGKARLLLAIWILTSLLTIAVGGLAALMVSIARATTPGRADHSRALVIVLVFVAIESAVGIITARAARSGAKASTPAAASPPAPGR